MVAFHHHCFSIMVSSHLSCKCRVFRSKVLHTATVSDTQVEKLKLYLALRVRVWLPFAKRRGCSSIGKQWTPTTSYTALEINLNLSVRQPFDWSNNVPNKILKFIWYKWRRCSTAVGKLLNSKFWVLVFQTPLRVFRVWRFECADPLKSYLEAAHILIWQYFLSRKSMRWPSWVLW